jgi:hypothetical protein
VERQLDNLEDQVVVDVMVEQVEQPILAAILAAQPITQAVAVEVLVARDPLGEAEQVPQAAMAELELFIVSAVKPKYTVVAVVAETLATVKQVDLTAQVRD